jgi:transposase
LRSPDAFTLRRCQILLASNRGQNAYQIAHQLGCNPQTARNAIHAFNQKGLPEALQPASKHPHTVHRAFDGEQAEALREMLHQDPRIFGKHTHTVAFGLWRWPPRSASKKDSPKSESRARPFGLPSHGWGCAGSGPNAGSVPQIRSMREKRRRDRLIGLAESRSEWVVGFLDETWWSRLARPALSSWSDAGEPPAPHRTSVAKDDPSEATKAISCYGLFVAGTVGHRGKSCGSSRH